MILIVKTKRVCFDSFKIVFNHLIILRLVKNTLICEKFDEDKFLVTHQ